MNSVLMAATIGCVVANASVAIADYARAPTVLANFAEVRFMPGALPYLATLKLAGAVGLLAGLLGVHWLGLAAGVGLTAFFVGALLVHVRARVFHNIAVPAAYLVLAVASTCFFAGKL
ncbi:DoxX family protein [Streptomyces brevispora]|uniref:DoxX family protein n=1 Tax=Streptomyces brevispora TaxID=887462 RepID=A0ABZ1G724_9ACTN|nr:DoxX family protein [Streptomyces brevispora]WSC15701.1 DoxX family protein [Streptomyces brevispora]